MEMAVIAVVAIVAFVAVLFPLFRRGTDRAADAREFDIGHAHDQDAIEETVPPIAAGPATPVAPTASGEHPHPERDEIEREVLRYREAIREGTLCARCGEANPAGSAYCSDCGKRLPLADAREFD